MDTRDAGRMGGRKYSDSLTPKQRQERARKAARAMHAKRKQSQAPKKKNGAA